ncbi:MAG: aminopeptidase P family N-terminal domain-containing protein, partial [Candidatus Aenigmarchaeota archaeon]|nr:aminopeptidase P family N-terminal domain-containing protein [Candidatus Aenigmarchaeota archaeon]
MIPDFATRQRNLRLLMDKKRIDAIFTSDPANIHYYIGYEGMRDDRMFMLLPRHGEPTLFVSILGNEAVKKYEKTVFYTSTKEIIKRIKHFKKLGYNEKKMNVFLFNKLDKLKIKMVPVGEMMELPRKIKDD